MAKKRAAKRKSEVKIEQAEENHDDEATTNGDSSAATGKKRKSGVKNGVPNETPASATKRKGAAKQEPEDDNESKKRKSGVRNEDSTNTNGTNASTSKKKSNAKYDSDDEDTTDYEVLKIVDVRYTKSDKREFLIRWKNYSPKQDSWEPEENLSCDALISKFLEDQEKRSKLRKKPASVKRFTLPAGSRRSKRTGGNRKNYIEAEDGDED